MTYTASYNGVIFSTTANVMDITSQTSFAIYSDDISQTGTLVPVILYATFNNTPAMVNSAVNFKLTTTNPCTTTSMTVTTMAGVFVPIL